MNNRLSPRRMVKNKLDLNKAAVSPHRNQLKRRRSLTKMKSTTSGSDTSVASANVKVVVRIRPLNQKEAEVNNRGVVRIVDEDVLVFDPKENEEPFFYHGVQQRGRDLLKKANKNIPFTFDRVFDSNSNNLDVFNDSTKNLIKSLMDGYNCSVFVYGATGAGKTHTMLGNAGNPGITILTMRALFDEIGKLSDRREFELGITYLEVYNETVKDLLNPGVPLHLREDGKFGVCVAGIKFHRIQNPEELFCLLEKGNNNRTQHPTDANAESSRSHAVFQVYVNMSTRNTGERRISKLSMIDLAGSERGAATGCTGMRFTEGANINKSLLALGNCINSLADGQRHVPYRDSKLTRLLKDSLGGNCQTVMIANISPCYFNYEDTYNTLKYAMRAKKIKSNMKKNVVNRELTIPQYAKLVDELNKEIETLRAGAQQEQLQQPQQTVCVNCTQERSIPNKEDPTWRAQFQTLIKERVELHKQYKRFVYSEKELEYRIKFKESAETFSNELCVDSEHMENAQKRFAVSVGTFQRQLRNILTQQSDIKEQQKEIETKITSLIDSENISETDNIDLIENKYEIKATDLILLENHTNKVIDLYKNEDEQKNKIIQRMCNMLNKYHQLLRGHGHITNDLMDEYRSVVRLTQGLRTVTWQMDECENVLAVKSEDSGIDVRSAISVPFCENNSNVTINILNNNDLLMKKPSETMKRKLYETKSSSTGKKKSLYSPRDETNLNLDEDIDDIQSSTINPNNLNSTFILHKKERKVTPKKLMFSSQEFLLPKVPRRDLTKPSINNVKNFNALTRTQRFPLRSKEQEKALSKVRRVNTAPIHR